MEIGKCVCYKCKTIFDGNIFTSWSGKDIRQEAVFCDSCIKENLEKIKQYTGFDKGTTIYTSKSNTIDHKKVYTLMEATITKISFSNFTSVYNPLINGVKLIDGEYVYDNDKLQDVLKTSFLRDFSAKYLMDRVTFILMADGRYYQRKFNEIFGDKKSAENYVLFLNEKLNKSTKSIDEKEIKDAYTMGQQDMVYRTIKTFLDSKEARTFGISGIDVTIEDGYVNATWKFNGRCENDIKE